MNKHIFQSLIDNITQHYGISYSDLFSESRDYETIEPRQLFFYLCHKKGIPVVSIQKFLLENNFSLHHSNIVRGVKKISNKVESNPDYDILIHRLETINVY